MALEILSVLVTAAAALDLLINRLGVRILHDRWNNAQLMTLSRVGTLGRNLAAVTGVSALLILLLRVLSQPARTWNAWFLRTALASFAAVFVPTTLLATILPAERTTVYVVIFGAGAAHVLTALLALRAGILGDSPRHVRIATQLFLLVALTGLLSIFVAVVEHDPYSTLGGRSMWLALRRLGEVAYLALPIVLTFGVWSTLRPPRHRLQWALVVIVTLLFTLAYVVCLRSSPAAFPVLLYGAQHFELFTESMPLLYAFPLSFGLGGAAASLSAGDPLLRERGMSALLLLSAGYAPRAPVQLLMLVLAAAFLVHSSLRPAE